MRIFCVLATTSVASYAQAQVGCLIEPSQISEVASLAPGTIAELRVERGSVVKRGQILAILSADLERASLDAAKQRASSEADVAIAAASRDLAKIKLKRTHELMALGHGTQMELDQAKTEHEVSDHRVQHAKDLVQIARKDVNVAQSQLEQRTVRSPIDGIVAERLLNIGERVDGKPLFRLVNLQKLKAELVLPATQFGQVREGMSMRLQPELGQSGSVMGQVTQVDKFLDAASGTFRARLSVNNFAQKIPAGAKCKVEVANSQSAPASR